MTAAPAGLDGIDRAGSDTAALVPATASAAPPAQKGHTP